VRAGTLTLTSVPESPYQRVRQLQVFLHPRNLIAFLFLLQFLAIPIVDAPATSTRYHGWTTLLKSAAPFGARLV
jgi:hypothetical protein